MKWVKRARVRQSEVARFRRWRATDAPYLVVEIASKLGLGKRYLALRVDGGHEVIVSRHRKRWRAEDSCDLDWHKRKRGV